MKSWVRKTLRAGVLAAGLLLFAASPAQAGDQVSYDNGGVLAGNNINIPINAAVPICGNGIGAVVGAGVGVGTCVATAGDSDEHEEEQTYVAPTEQAVEEADQVAVDNGGVASGNNIRVPINASVPICGNGVGILGLGLGIASCSATTGAEEADQIALDNGGVIAGNNISVPVNLAIPVCGNGIGAVLGAGVGIANCDAVAGPVDDDDDNGDDNGDNGDNGDDNDDHGYSKRNESGDPFTVAQQQLPSGVQVPQPQVPVVGSIPTLVPAGDNSISVNGMELTGTLDSTTQFIPGAPTLG